MCGRVPEAPITGQAHAASSIAVVQADDDSSMTIATPLSKARFVDVLAPQAEWRLVHRIADAATLSVSRAVAYALRAPVEETDYDALVDRLTHGDVDGAVAAVDLAALSTRLTSKVWPLLFETFRRAGDIVTRQARAGGIQKASARVSTAFNATNPHAVAWAEKHAARLVVDVTQSTRDGIRTLVRDAFVKQIPPRTLAKQIRVLIGPTKQQIGAIIRQRDRWIADGLSADTIQSRLARAGATAIRDRALTIARTETMFASNSGQLAAWGQARSEGLIDSELVKEWIITPDSALCEICAPLEGMQVGMDDDFPGGVQNPPLHVNCRCAAGLAPPRQ